MAFRAVAYQETLQAGGVPVEIARAHAKAMEEFVVGELVTRDYFRDHLDSRLAQFESRIDGKFGQVEGKLDQVEGRLEAKIAQVEGRLEGRIGSLESKIDGKLADLGLRVVRWVVGSVGAAAIGIIVTVLAALFVS